MPGFGSQYLEAAGGGLKYLEAACYDRRQLVIPEGGWGRLGAAGGISSCTEGANWLNSWGKNR